MLTEEQIRHLENRLLEERHQASQALRSTSADIESNSTDDGDLSKIPSHLADQASDVQDEELDTIVAERESDRIEAIDDALRRLREQPDTFDVSAISGARIPYERLDLIPWTRVLADEAESVAEGASRSTRDTRSQDERARER
jgi:RNA polymerase-binding transcription factor DksA